MNIVAPFRRDVLVYISGPLTAKGGRTIEENVADALTAYWECIHYGIPAFSPHLSGIYPTAYTISYETWLEYDYAIIDRCTHIYLLPRWRESTGAQLEKAYAESKGIPVIFSLVEIV